MQEFQTSFSALEGITIGEKRRNLFQLLNRHKNSPLDFKTITTATPLEEKFKLETLIRLGKIPELIEMLTCENSQTVRRILKMRACCNAICNYSDEQLLSLLAQVSFDAKLKILNKVGNRGGRFFESVLKRYGFYLASRLLPNCDSGTVLDVIVENRWVPTARQLIIVIERHPDVAERILKHLLSRKKSKGQYDKVLAWVAKTDSALVTKLYEADISYGMGRRTTHRFVKHNRPAVAKSPSFYYKFLHHKEIAKAIGPEFPEMLLNLFPRRMEKFNEELPELIKVLKSAKPELLFDTFFRKYGIQLWEYSDAMVPQVWRLMGTDQRVRLLKPEHKGTLTEDEWMCYASIDKSVPYILKRISLTSDIAARAELMELLVETCKINESGDALAEACRYVVSRHRNDHMTVRLAFLRRIRTSFGLKNLSDEHWGPIYELMQLFSLNNETFFHLLEFLEPYIQFRLSTNQPVRDQLTMWIKAHTGNLNICKETPVYERQCLLEFVELIPTVLTDEFSIGYIYNIFLNAIINWNKRHRKEPLSPFLFKDAFQEVNTMLSGTNKRTYTISAIVKYCIQNERNADEWKQLLSLYLSPNNKFLELNVLKWLCAKEPRMVADSIDAMTNLLLPMYELTRHPRFWLLFLNYTHLNLPERIKEICTVRYKDTTDYVAQNSIAALSFLLTPDEYESFVKGNQGEKTAWKHLGKCVKHLPPTPPTLNTLLLYTKSHQALIRNALQTIVGVTNEPRLRAFFGSLGAHKLVVQLTLRSLGKADVLEIVSDTLEAAKSVAFNKFVLKTTSKFFAQNPDDDSWRLLKLIVEKVDSSDRNVCEAFVLKTIPSTYFSDYFVLLWGVLNEHESNASSVEQLLDSVTSANICMLSKEICIRIIESNLWKRNWNENLQSSVHSFTAKFLIYHGNDTDTVRIFAILKEYTSKAWYDYDIQSRGRASINNFVRVFCSEYLSDASQNLEVLQKFVELWNGSFTPRGALDEYLHLELTRIYAEHLPVAKIADLCNDLVKRYGLMAVAPFCDKLVSFLGYFVKDTGVFVEEERYSFFQALYKSTPSDACRVLFVLLLDRYPATVEDTLKQYKAMLGELETCDNVVVKFYLRNHLNAIKIH